MDLPNQAPVLDITYFINEEGAFFLVDDILRYGITQDAIAKALHTAFPRYDIMTGEVEDVEDKNQYKAVWIVKDNQYPFPPDLIAKANGLIQELIAERFAQLN